MTDSDGRRVDLERRIAAIRAELTDCVRELLVDDDLPRFAVAERLAELGSAFDSALENLCHDPFADADVVALAGLLAITNGNRDWSAHVLLDEVRKRGTWSTLAAKRLAQARVPGVCGVVLEALRATEPHEFDSIVGLLDALRAAGCTLPAADRSVVLSNPHWQVTTAVAESFPSEGG